jgi:Tfp pilus assembly protein PilV
VSVGRLTVACKARAIGASRLRSERGVTLIEVLLSLVLLLVGLLGIFGTLSGSTDSIVAAERTAVMAQVGQQALQSAESLPYADLADSSAPIQTSTSLTTNPTYYLAGCTAGGCTGYQWDSSTTASVETIVLDATDGKVTPLTTAVVPAPKTSGCTATATANCQIVVTVYAWVTNSTDSVCSQAGNTCVAGTPSYKRVTIAVKNAGNGPPTNPIYFSTFVSNNVGGTNDPLDGATSSTTPTTCVDGSVTVACTH